jgi:hypothetical protein
MGQRAVLGANLEMHPFAAFLMRKSAASQSHLLSSVIVVLSNLNPTE